MYKCLYPIRTTELPWIKRNRLKVIRRIIGEEEEDSQQFELSRFEFLLIASMYQLNLNYLIIFLDLAISYGGVVVCVAYVVLTGMLGMPLFMLFTFMSSYSKKSYLKFWDCVPLFEGLGYALAIIRFTTEMYNCSAIGICLMLIPDLFNNGAMAKMKQCQYGHEQCIPMDTTQNYTIICDSNLNETISLIATQYYIRRHIMEINLEGGIKNITINTKWLLATVITWIVMFVVAIQGLKRIRRVTIVLQLVFVSILFCVCVIAILHVNRQSTATYFASKGMDALLNFGFWADILLHSAETNVLCNMIWLGAMKPESFNSKYAAIIASPVKVVILILVVCFCSITIEETLKNYRIHDPTCLEISGFHFFFVFVPDVLHRTKISRLLNLFWYLGILYFAFISPLYSIIALVDSIIQKYSNLMRYRLYVYLVLCCIGFLINLTLLFNFSMVLVRIWQKHGMLLLTSMSLLLVNLAVCFVYSTKRIIDDYTFTYGSPPEKYWVVLWESSPIFAIFAVIFVLQQIRSFEISAWDIQIMVIFSYLLCVLFLLPVFVILFSRCCKHITYRTLSTLSKPADTWGPFLQCKREERNYYYPHRDIKCMNPILKCKHKCIVSKNNTYRNEVFMQTKKTDKLKAQVQEYIEKNQLL